MKRSRGWGEGGLYKRQDGRWAGAISLGTQRMADGRVRRVRREVYGATKTEVARKLNELRLEHSRGEDITDRLTLAIWFERFLEESARPTIGESTFIQYKAQVKNHIVPALGRIPLRRLTSDHIAAFYADLERDGVSVSTRRAIHLRLHRALAVAVKRSLIQRNVAAAVDPPRYRVRTMSVLNVEEARRFLEAARSDRLYPFYLLAVTTGLRQGELFALKWADVNLAEAFLSVRGTLKSVRGRIYIGEPKSAKGRRLVDLGPDVVEALGKHKAARPPDVDWVFTDTAGGPLHKSNLIRRSFRPLLLKAGLPRIRFHDLRHTAATLLMVQKINPKIVQGRLGHSSIDVTMNTYSHVLPGLQREAADSIDALLRIGEAERS